MGFENEMKKSMPSFKSTDMFTLDNSLVFVVELDRKTIEFEHIIGKHIKIDGEVYKGLGVSTYAIVPPFNVGLPICIGVET